MKRGTPDHPKTKLLAKRLGLRRYQAVGLLESLWHFTSSYAKRGNIGKWSNEAIASEIDWDGDPTELMEAFVYARFVDRCKTHRLLVHDWEEHADQTVRRSEEVSKLGFASCTPANASQPEPTPEPEPEPKPLLPTEVSGELSSKASPPPSGRESGLTEFEFPTTGKGGRSWILSQAKLAEYIAAYPTLEVPREMAKARQWCRDHPTQRKTAGGMPGFLTRWLNRAVDSVPASKNGARSGSKEPLSAMAKRQRGEA